MPKCAECKESVPVVCQLDDQCLDCHTDEDVEECVRESSELVWKDPDGVSLLDLKKARKVNNEWLGRYREFFKSRV